MKKKALGPYHKINWILRIISGFLIVRLDMMKYQSYLKASLEKEIHPFTQSGKFKNRYKVDI